MAKIINITDKLSNEQPKIVIGEKEYIVNDGMETVLKFEELAAVSTINSMGKAIEVALGKEAANDINIKKTSLGNFKVISIAILAAMQGLEYEEAAERFQSKK